jgi:hypothetical protein
MSTGFSIGLIFGPVNQCRQGEEVLLMDKEPSPLVKRDRSGCFSNYNNRNRFTFLPK